MRGVITLRMGTAEQGLSSDVIQWVCILYEQILHAAVHLDY